MTWDELVAEVTARHPLHEGKMFGMSCLKRENGKVVAGHWKDGGLTVKLGSRMVDSSLRNKLNAIRHAMKEAR